MRNIARAAATASLLLAASPAAAATSLYNGIYTYTADTVDTFTTQYAGIYGLTAFGGAGGRALGANGASYTAGGGAAGAGLASSLTGGGGGGGYQGAGGDSSAARGGLPGPAATGQASVSGGGKGGNGGGGAGGTAGGGGGGYAGGVGGTYAVNGTGAGGGGGRSFVAQGLTDTAGASLKSTTAVAKVEPLRYFASGGFDTTTVDFGMVRGGMTIARSVTVRNTGPADARTDLLSVVGQPGNAFSGEVGGTVGLVSNIAGGQSGSALVQASFSSGASGQRTGVVTMGLKTCEAANRTICGTATPVTITVMGTVTELASAVLASSGAGSFASTAGGYLLDFGDVTADGAPLSAAFSVVNGAGTAFYAERLGGSFGGLSIDGFGFAGGSFANLAGGQTTGLGTLTFSGAGLAAGLYERQIDLSLFSRYAGFADTGLAGQRIMVRANLLAAVPEPATWGLMLSGFGLVGGALRSRRDHVASAAER